MSIKKLLPLGVSVCTNGFRQETKTLNYVIRLISSASKGTNGSTATSRTNNFTRNGRVLIHTRNLKSSKFHQRSSGYLSDPGNVGKRQSGVNFDTLGSWNNRLGLDVNLKQSIASGKLIPQIDVGTAASASVIGRRKQNEDRVTIDEISPDLILFAIYDGHGGALAVDFVSEHMAEHVRFWVSERNETNLGEILKMAFHDVHAAFIRHLLHQHAGDDAVLNSGCTATVCLLHQGVHLVVGHVGDSQALLCRGGDHVTLSREHKPVKAERERIERNGGFVTHDNWGNPRVNGILEMSRSIGDAALKKYGVIADPDIKSIQLRHGSDAFLLLTTDGVHSVLNERELCDVICTCATPQEAADFVTDQALHYGSEDNCTALVLPFASWGKYADRKRVNFRFVRSQSSSRYQ